MLVMAALGTQAQATTYFRDITSVGTSAEMMGIGNVEGFSHQASVLLENPAGLGYAENSFSGFYTSYYGGANYMTSAISYKAFPELTLGVGTAYEWSTGLDYTSENNSGEFVVEDTFGAHSAQFVGGFSYAPKENISIGGSWTKYVTKLYDISGSGSDFGVGFLYESKIGDILLSGKNLLGGKITYSDEASEKLMRQWSVGIKSVPLPLLDSEVYAQVKRISGVADLSKSIGVRVYPLKNKSLSLSVGYKQKLGVTELKDTMTAGVGLNLGTTSLQYGYDTTDVYQNSQQHYVSLCVKY